MKSPKLVISCYDRVLYRGTSESGDGVLSFRAEEDPDWISHAATPLSKIVDLPAITLETSATRSSVVNGMILVELTDHAAVYFTLGRPEGDILFGSTRNWVPLGEATLGDLIELSGLEKFAEPVEIANPFGSVL